MLYERIRTIFTLFVVLGNPLTASTTDAPFTPKRFHGGCQSGSGAISARSRVTTPSRGWETRCTESEMRGFIYWKRFIAGTEKVEMVHAAGGGWSPRSSTLNSRGRHQDTLSEVGFPSDLGGHHVMQLVKPRCKGGGAVPQWPHLGVLETVIIITIITSIIIQIYMNIYKLFSTLSWNTF